MISYARLTPGKGFRPIKALMYYSMRLLPFRWSRWLIASLFANVINLLSVTTSVVDSNDGEIKSNLEILQKKGWAPLKPLLSAAQIEDVLLFLKTKKPIGVGRASYQLDDVLRCPHLLSTINHPAVLSIARHYLGCPATISSIGIHLTTPVERQPVGVQCFHRDMDEWKFFKLFVYLSDVDEETGPHEFVEGSQRTSGSIMALPCVDEKLEQSHRRKILGPAGTTFIADTWGIHRGNMPISKPRLILQVQYSILPIAMFDYTPVNIPFPDYIDRYTNRLLLA
jgi:hypothetical protein